ncbi:MAG: SWIM zinc finger family protein [Hahellaceae bacterium]|nr:SWIM zinc finger family protein [Hahellaceae bacterium]MCP5169212.1 SWIM zinc finger family protein [Hahellaceae bacterium]
MTLSREQIVALAPDSASVKAAEKLISPAKWPTLQFNEAAVWGECQGSGSKPYQSRIDLSGPAFKCSCPSRKFPCKHGLALFLLFAERQDKFTEAATCPEWVGEWLSSRQIKNQQKIDKAEQRQEAAARPKTAEEAAAQSQRQEKREQRVSQGVTDLQRWLGDTARLGLAELRNKNYSYWENLSARLIDAQASGLAGRVRHLGELVIQAASYEQIAEEWGALSLLLSAWQQVESLPEMLQQDIRSQIGWSQAQEDALSTPAVTDQWLVLSHRLYEDDRLLRQEIFLKGLQTQGFARLLQFAHATQKAGLLQGWMVGQVYPLSLHYYPATLPDRAVPGLTQRGLESLPADTIVMDFPFLSAQAVVEEYQRRLLQLPWLAAMPVVVQGALMSRQALIASGSGTVLPHQDSSWYLCSGQVALPLQMSAQTAWKLLAVAASPARLFGLWNGQVLQPHGVWQHAEVTGEVSDYFDLQVSYLTEHQDD